jgi:hypothetical protein
VASRTEGASRELSTETSDHVFRGTASKAVHGAEESYQACRSARGAKKIGGIVLGQESVERCFGARPADDGPLARWTGRAVMACEQVLDDRGDAFGLLRVEVSVFEEGKVAGAAGIAYLMEDAPGMVPELAEFLAGRVCKHGREL